MVVAADRNLRILLASSAGLVQRFLQVVSTLVTLPLVLHTLGIAGFGVWGAATSLAWLSGVLDLGIGSALITLIPRAFAAGSEADVRTHVSAALAGACGLSLLIVGVGLGLVGAGLSRSGSVTLAVAGLAVNVPLSIANSIWYSLQRGHIAAGWELLQTTMTVLFLFLGATAGAGTSQMVLAVYGALILANLGSWMHLLVSHPEIRPNRIAPDLDSLKVIITRSGMLFGISICIVCSYLFDNVLTLHWLGERASAQMTMAMRLCTTAAGIFAVITQPLWPAFVHAETGGDRAWSLRLLVLGTLFVTGTALLGAALLGCFGSSLMTWWLHDDIGSASGLFWATGAWIVVLCAPRVASLLLSASRILRPQLVAAAAALVVAMLLKFQFAQHYGPAGVLCATTMSWLLIMWPTYLVATIKWKCAVADVLMPITGSD